MDSSTQEQFVMAGVVATALLYFSRHGYIVTNTFAALYAAVFWCIRKIFILCLLLLLAQLLDIPHYLGFHELDLQSTRVRLHKKHTNR